MAVFVDYQTLSAQLQLDATPNMQVPAWVHQQIGNQDLCRRCRALFQYDLTDNTKSTHVIKRNPLSKRTVLPLSTPIFSEICTLCCFIWKWLDSSSQESIRIMEKSLAQVNPIPDMTIDFVGDAHDIEYLQWTFEVGTETVGDIVRIGKCMHNLECNE